MRRSLITGVCHPQAISSLGSFSSWCAQSQRAGIREFYQPLDLCMEMFYAHMHPKLCLTLLYVREGSVSGSCSAPETLENH